MVTTNNEGLAKQIAELEAARDRQQTAGKTSFSKTLYVVRQTGQISHRS